MEKVIGKTTVRAGTRISILLLLACVLCGTAIAESSKHVKVGVSIALTGPLSVVGETLKNAILLAQQKYDPQQRVQFIFEDDVFLPKNTVGIVNKFISEDKVDALIVFGASTSFSVVNVAEKNKIPLVGMTVLETLEQGKQYVLRFFVSTEDLNERTIAEFTKRNYKDVAVVATVQDATLRQRDHFIDAHVSKIVLSQEFLPADLDFRASVSRIRALNPAAVYIIMLPPQGSTFAKQLRASGYSGQIVGSLQLASPAEIKNSEGALVGAWIPSGDDRHAKDFYADYEKAYPDAKAFSESVYAYDLAKLMIEAAASGDINRYLHSVKNFQGALGNYGSNGKNSFQFGVTVREVTKDGFRYLD
ncbi:MAG: ABC transporter substrate-binding protein [Deltaproteobacteria bacterium]|nr:ABC transporter substrate-binding protein [Deltaproteobacteria bacterium]